MHHVGTFEDASLVPHPVFSGHSEGYLQAGLIGPHTGSVHTGLSVAELAPNGVVHPHVHAYEEGFYILSGQLVATIGAESYVLGPGDYGCVKVGTLHSLRTSGIAPVRWLEMAAPQPKPAGAERDTFFSKDQTVPASASSLDVANTRGNLLGHFGVAQIPPVAERQNVLKGLEGVYLNWLIDEKFGAAHHRLLLIEYQPGVSIGLHDHTFEEGYFLLSGQVEATMDGKKYTARPGHVLWTGVGCVHAFANVSDQPVVWLETFAPQPPRENAFRFMAEWTVKARELEG